MSKLSNQQGRALEYIIVNTLQHYLPQISLTPRALEAQNRDQLHYRNLNKDLQINFSCCVEHIYKWLEQQFALSQFSNQIEIDRSPDGFGIKGLVTDIQIQLNQSRIINLSIKHHHKAVKHHRPSSTAQQCGYIRNSEQDITFRKQYQSITDTFITHTNGYTKFKDLDYDIKSKFLYKLVCKLVANFINLNCQVSDKAESLFRFLIGNTDYYKIVYMSSKKQIIIQAFEKISSISSVKAETENQYVILTFSNNWRIKMRLHSAATIIKKNPSLKFDAQPDLIVVPETRLFIH